MLSLNLVNWRVRLQCVCLAADPLNDQFAVITMFREGIFLYIAFGPYTSETTVCAFEQTQNEQ